MRGNEKAFKETRLIIVLLAVIIILLFGIIILLLARGDNTSPIQEPTKIEKKDNKTKEKDKSITDNSNLLSIVDNLRLYLYIGDEYTSLTDVPNENIAFFIQGNTNVEGIDYGYTFGKDEYLTYCLPPDCPKDSIVSEDISLTSAQGLNRGYLFDRVKEYGKTTFRRDISLNDIKGDYLSTYKDNNKDYIIDSNGGFTGPITIKEIKSIKENNGVVEVLISLDDAENRYETILFVFKLLNNSTLDNIKLDNIEILTFEIK